MLNYNPPHRTCWTKLTSPGSWCTLSWLCRVLLGFLSSRKKKNASKKCPLIKEKRPISGWGVRKSFFCKIIAFSVSEKGTVCVCAFFFFTPQFFHTFSPFKFIPLCRTVAVIWLAGNPGHECWKKGWAFLVVFKATRRACNSTQPWRRGRSLSIS